MLESAIVWQGARTYGALSALCRRAAAPLGLLAVASFAGPARADALSALHEAEASLQPLRNGVYLYLRVAGIVWIGVEWVAAILLWRGAGDVERAVRRHA